MNVSEGPNEPFRQPGLKFVAGAGVDVDVTPDPHNDVARVTITATGEGQVGPAGPEGPAGPPGNDGAPGR